MAARCRGQVHCVTSGSEAGGAGIAAAGGCRPVCGQCGSGYSARGDDQHIRPIAQVVYAVSARADDEAVGPRAASQRIIARTAIEAIIAIAAAEAVVARSADEAIGAGTADQRIGIGRAGQSDRGAIASIADQPTMAARCRGQVHDVTSGSDAGRAGIAAAEGRRPIRSQCGIGCGARRDEQHIRPIAEVVYAVSAGTDDEAVSPRAAGQRIIA